MSYFDGYDYEDLYGNEMDDYCDSPDDYDDDSLDGDFDSAMRDAGLGYDEQYGPYGEDD